MHFPYLCKVIRKLRAYKQLISSLWIGIMTLSIALIVLHQHDHSEDSCSSHTKQEHHQSNGEDCQYCYLFFQQGIQFVKDFSWESRPTEFQLSSISNFSKPEFPQLNPKKSKSLRAPPLANISLLFNL